MNVKSKINKLLVIPLLFYAFTCLSFNKNDATLPNITFEKPIVDFGKIKLKPNTAIDIKFYFKNTGRSPLLIYKIDVSCGCTVPYWNKKPIEKNQRDYIKVRFKPTNKGIVLKSLFVKTNTREKVTDIVLKGEIN